MNNQGMLSLQMGTVTGAVDDLLHGYDQLVATLPNLAEKVSMIQGNTETMANELEDRIKHLVDGYQYLDSVSSQVPDSLREMASAFHKDLLKSNQVLTPEEKLLMEKQTRQLDALKAELRSIAHERVVADVLTRGIISNAKTTRPRGQVILKSTSIGPKKSLALDTEIPLPSYSQYIHDKMKKQTDTQASRQSNSLPLQDRSLNKLFTRPLGEGIMVPSMRQGSLPPEVQNLKTNPHVHVTVPESSYRPRLVRRPRREDQSKELARNVKRSEDDINNIREQLLETVKKIDDRKGVLVPELQELVKRIKQDQAQHAHQLEQTVEKVVGNALHRLGDTAPFGRSLSPARVVPASSANTLSGSVNQSPELAGYRVLTARATPGIPSGFSPPARQLPLRGVTFADAATATITATNSSSSSSPPYRDSSQIPPFNEMHIGPSNTSVSRDIREREQGTDWVAQYEIPLGLGYAPQPVILLPRGAAEGNHRPAREAAGHGYDGGEAGLSGEGEGSSTVNGPQSYQLVGDDSGVRWRLCPQDRLPHGLAISKGSPDVLHGRGPYGRSHTDAAIATVAQILQGSESVFPFGSDSSGTVTVVSAGAGIAEAGGGVLTQGMIPGEVIILEGDKDSPSVYIPQSGRGGYEGVRSAWGEDKSSTSRCDRDASAAEGYADVGSGGLVEMRADGPLNLDIADDGSGGIGFLHQDILRDRNYRHSAGVGASPGPFHTGGASAFPSRKGPYLSRVVAATDTINRTKPTAVSAVTEPVVRAAESSAGVDKELVQLLQTVVLKQQETLQGNQALLMRMIEGSQPQRWHDEDDDYDDDFDAVNEDPAVEDQTIISSAEVPLHPDAPEGITVEGVNVAAIGPAPTPSDNTFTGNRAANGSSVEAVAGDGDGDGNPQHQPTSQAQDGSVPATSSEPPSLPPRQPITTAAAAFRGVVSRVMKSPSPSPAPSRRDSRQGTPERRGEPAGPSAAEIALALAGAIGGLMDQHQQSQQQQQSRDTWRDVEARATELATASAASAQLQQRMADDIAIAVKRGVAEGVKDALALMEMRMDAMKPAGDYEGPARNARKTFPPQKPTPVGGKSGIGSRRGRHPLPDPFDQNEADTDNVSAIDEYDVEEEENLSSRLKVRPSRGVVRGEKVIHPNQGLLHIRGLGSGVSGRGEGAAGPVLEYLVAQDLLDSRNRIAGLRGATGVNSGGSDDDDYGDGDGDDDIISIQSDGVHREALRDGTERDGRSLQRNRRQRNHIDSDSPERWFDGEGDGDAAVPTDRTGGEEGRVRVHDSIAAPLGSASSHLSTAGEKDSQHNDFDGSGEFQFMNDSTHRFGRLHTALAPDSEARISRSSRPSLYHAPTRRAASPSVIPANLRSKLRPRPLISALAPHSATSAVAAVDDRSLFGSSDSDLSLSLAHLHGTALDSSSERGHLSAGLGRGRGNQSAYIDGDARPSVRARLVAYDLPDLELQRAGGGAGALRHNGFHQSVSSDSDELNSRNSSQRSDEEEEDDDDDDDDGDDVSEPRRVNRGAIQAARSPSKGRGGGGGSTGSESVDSETVPSSSSSSSSRSITASYHSNTSLSASSSSSPQHSRHRVGRTVAIERGMGGKEWSIAGNGGRSRSRGGKERKSPHYDKERRSPHYLRTRVRDGTHQKGKGDKKHLNGDTDSDVGVGIATLRDSRERGVSVNSTATEEGEVEGDDADSISEPESSLGDSVELGLGGCRGWLGGEADTGGGGGGGSVATTSGLRLWRPVQGRVLGDWVVQTGVGLGEAVRRVDVVGLGDDIASGGEDDDDVGDHDDGD